MSEAPRPSFSLYVHIPYCDSKCPYCDFNSYAAKQWPEDAYVEALIAEMKARAAEPPARDAELGTIFFGGGTPSLFAPSSIAAILTAAFDLWPPFHGGAIEVTLEANPGTVDAAKLRGFRGAGVNRVSFGVQSFQPRHLQTLGRIHDAAQAEDAIRSARAAGFADVNLDLMFAVPNQTVEEWELDLRRAVALGTDHVSAYNLTFEEGTPFDALRRKGLLAPLAEEIEVAMLGGAEEVLGAAGLERYEISNYARPGHECRHNLNYWRGGAYLGVGAGAHSYAPTPAHGGRWSNEKLPARYVERITESGDARVFTESLSEKQARGELVFLALRCREGFAPEEFRRRFSADFLTAFPHAESLRRDGFLDLADGRWRLTRRGLLVADAIFATFV